MTIIRKFEIEENQKKFPKKYIILTIFCLLTLAITEIWASNTVASFGERFASISALKTAITLENQILENEVAKYSSLTSVASESAKLGFSKITSIQYIR